MGLFQQSRYSYLPWDSPILFHKKNGFFYAIYRNPFMMACLCLFLVYHNFGVFLFKKLILILILQFESNFAHQKNDLKLKYPGIPRSVLCSFHLS